MVGGETNGSNQVGVAPGATSFLLKLLRKPVAVIQIHLMLRNGLWRQTKTADGKLFINLDEE